MISYLPTFRVIGLSLTDYMRLSRNNKRVINSKFMGYTKRLHTRLWDTSESYEVWCRAAIFFVLVLSPEVWQPLPIGPRNLSAILTVTKRFNRTGFGDRNGSSKPSLIALSFEQWSSFGFLYIRTAALQNASESLGLFSSGPQFGAGAKPWETLEDCV